MSSTESYLKGITARFNSGIAREHAYRGDLQNLLESKLKNIQVTNEPARVECGAPDFILQRDSIPVGYIEAKDLGKDLDAKEYKEQFERYLNSLPNIIFTNYLEFKFYLKGENVANIKIAELKNKKVSIIPENFKEFERLLLDFTNQKVQTITSTSILAKMMAGKAQLMASILEKALLSDEENEIDSTLRDQLISFRNILIADLKVNEFADIYAQTVSYGLFAARLHDKSLDSFSRYEAADLIPKSNPFLRNLFGYIAGPNLDDRIKWLVDALVDIFRATDISLLLNDFMSKEGASDPIIHFYENFLQEYDAKIRKNRGVWYTPEPLVSFIVRSIDDVLVDDFKLIDGLSDTSKTEIILNTQNEDKRTKTRYKQIKKEVHKVQVLDPATGTGTFLAEIIKHIYKKFDGQEGAWSDYVEEHLVPRLNGFEILMAPYAMAHLKLDLMLKTMGYEPNRQDRFKIFLTNALEEHHPDTGTLFSSWLAKEANEANFVKRDNPVMIVTGNPPYKKHSVNKGPWISKLMESYKKESTGEKLKERNSKWLNDDYVKFIRYGQFLIEKNGYGILAYVSNNGFLDNPTFRGMRYSLLNNFDKIYILDLHGNSNKKEKSPDGKKDENVFNIKQGVSIGIFVRSPKFRKGKLGEVFKEDIFGLKSDKYNYLNNNSISKIALKKIAYQEPHYFFTEKNFTGKSKYDKGFSLGECFLDFSTGYYTSCDDVVIAPTVSQLKNQVEEAHPSREFDNELVYDTAYRPFDNRKLYYDEELITRSRSKFVKKIDSEDNLILITGKGTKSKSVSHFFVSKFISELKCGEYSMGSYMFPLFMKNKSTGKRRINVSEDVICKFSEAIDLPYSEKETAGNQKEFNGFDLFHYIYAYLYSNKYRAKYEEFLKIDFPTIPYPKDKRAFFSICALGSELVSIHMLKNKKCNNISTKFSVSGDNKVLRTIGQSDFEINKKSATGKVWINDKQYFENVSVDAWEFFVGGYQPAQKWLKDRKGKKLSYDDIKHYQSIIASLEATIDIMEKVDHLI